VRVLPYSIDLMQMAWTLDLAGRFYTPQRNIVRDGFNTMVQTEKLGNMVSIDSMPELTLRYPGFPRTAADKTEALRLISMKTHINKPTSQAEIDIKSANPIQEIDPELLRYETEVAIGCAATDADIEEHRRSLIGAGYPWGVSGDVFNYDTWADHLQASMVGRGNTDGKVDESGGYTDPAHVSMLDAEYMFEARLVERRCLAGIDGFKHLGITAPDGSTYSYLETNPPGVRQVGQKSKTISEPPRMRASSAARTLGQYAPRPAAAGPSGARPAIGLRDGDSRDEC